MLPRNKTGGVVTTTVMGVGGLIVGVILILVIVSTILNADLFADSLSSLTTFNETTAAVNEVGVTLTYATLYNPTCSILTVENETTGETIVAANYTTFGTGGCSLKFVGADLIVNNSVMNVSYSTTYAGKSEAATRDMSGNFTTGINNISAKIPTILLIVAVVFLFGALVLLLRQSNAMGIGTGSSL